METLKLTAAQKKAFVAVAGTQRDTGGGMAFKKFEKGTYKALQKKGLIYIGFSGNSATLSAKGLGIYNNRKAQNEQIV